MRLTDLDPRWLIRDGVRVGFVFRCPVRGHKGHWLSCFFAPTPEGDQEALICAELGEDAMCAQCNEAHGWRTEPSGQQATAEFASLSIHPSINGGELPYGWHGHITGGAIVGGLPQPGKSA